MKNLLLIFSIIFILTSCGKNELGMEIENTNSGKIETQTGNVVKTENNTGTIQEEPVKEVKKTRNIAIENFNVVLKEDGKTINKLTTRATGQKECDLEGGDEGTKTIYNYKIIAENGNYGIVKKEEEPCGAHITIITYFGIDLENNTELTEILKIPFKVKEKLENNILKFIILEPQFIVENEADLDRSSILASDLKNDGFKKEGNDWVKTIDLKNIIKTEIKKTEEPKLDSKYSDENLKKNGYKLNNLGNIKEYYKKTSYDNDQPQNDGGLVEYSNIFIQGDKILDINCNYREWGGTSGFAPKITIFDGKNTKELYSIPDNKNDAELSLEMEITPIPAIFKEGKSKLIVDGNLNSIKIVDKENNIYEIIWNR